MKTATAPTALSAFLRKVAEIETSLDALRALAADHFWTHPDKIDWADVGTVEKIADDLDRALHFARGDAK